MCLLDGPALAAAMRAEAARRWRRRRGLARPGGAAAVPGARAGGAAGRSGHGALVPPGPVRATSGLWRGRPGWRSRCSPRWRRPWICSGGGRPAAARSATGPRAWTRWRPYARPRRSRRWVCWMRWSAAGEGRAARSRLRRARRVVGARRLGRRPFAADGHPGRDARHRRHAGDRPSGHRRHHLRRRDPPRAGAVPVRAADRRLAAVGRRPGCLASSRGNHCGERG